MATTNRRGVKRPAVCAGLATMLAAFGVVIGLAQREDAFVGSRDDRHRSLSLQTGDAG